MPPAPTACPQTRLRQRAAVDRFDRMVGDLTRASQVLAGAGRHMSNNRPTPGSHLEVGYDPYRA